VIALEHVDPLWAVAAAGKIREGWLRNCEGRPVLPRRPLSEKNKDGRLF